MGAGIATVIYFRFQSHFPDISPYWFITAGVGLGTSCQQAIHKLLVGVFAPPFKLLAFHEKLLELRRLLEHNKINKETHDDLVKRLCERRFLDK